MKQYQDLIRYVLDNGTPIEDRTGVGTLSVFGRQMRFNLQKGFPLVTTKRTWFKGVAHELLWFLSGDTNTQYLVDNDVHIWDAWVDENGNLGPVYGAQWRNWPSRDYVYGRVDNGWGIDQIANLVEQIKTNPYSRRHIVTAWNPDEVDDMALPPCHTMFQFNVRPGSERDILDCQLYQRSADIFLGVPFNIASYALLTHMVAQVCDLQVGDFVHTMGNAHIYKNHIEQSKMVLEREPLMPPTLLLNSEIKDIDDFTYDDIHLMDYNSHPAIKAEVAV